MDIKAIETRYKGYRFRSRLEARWAVFFDALSIPFEYEKEGYVLPNGQKYLPDFWLPNLHWWWEVKGPEPSPAEVEKCRQLRDGTGNAVFLCQGVPPDHTTTVFCWDISDSGGGSSEWQVAKFVWSPWATLVPCVIGSQYRQLCATPPAAQFKTLRSINCDCEGLSTLHDDTDVELMLPERTKVDEAYEAARSARFEHGESGA